MDDIRELYRRLAVSLPWQEGDILMLDNMLTAHGRNPYLGERKIVVAMGEMMNGQPGQHGRSGGNNGDSNR